MSGTRVIRLNEAPAVGARPACPGCGDKLQPYWEVVKWGQLQKPGSKELNEVRWTGHYRSYGRFCGLRCATDFANAVVKLADQDRKVRTGLLNAKLLRG